ncbi:hypothetical protein [Antrihabitans sp. YC2-6]|uniref:hypothetical protein n=1 Tax=Antrihabitans sp. YC2-6 TaxID=2799498 RepID=UPI0018F39D2E|nr:hypothetical protein [Antrihabitans sp. YC2-6]MBJ8348579.1 hypothetical protein [Antrihabitans sp. YC2-6]
MINPATLPTLVKMNPVLRESVLAETDYEKYETFLEEIRKRRRPFLVTQPAGATDAIVQDVADALEVPDDFETTVGNAYVTASSWREIAEAYRKLVAKTENARDEHVKEKTLEILGDLNQRIENLQADLTKDVAALKGARSLEEVVTKGYECVEAWNRIGSVHTVTYKNIRKAQHVITPYDLNDAEAFLTGGHRLNYLRFILRNHADFDDIRDSIRTKRTSIIDMGARLGPSPWPDTALSFLLWSVDARAVFWVPKPAQYATEAPADNFPLVSRQKAHSMVTDVTARFED